MEITMKNTRFEDSLQALAALAALRDPSPDPLLQNLVSHAPEVRKAGVAQGTTPSNYCYFVTTTTTTTTTTATTTTTTTATN